jgi:hypothetical protein
MKIVNTKLLSFQLSPQQYLGESTIVSQVSRKLFELRIIWNYFSPHNNLPPMAGSGMGTKLGLHPKFPLKRGLIKHHRLLSKSVRNIQNFFRKSISNEY